MKQSAINPNWKINLISFLVTAIFVAYPVSIISDWYYYDPEEKICIEYTDGNVYCDPKDISLNFAWFNLIGIYIVMFVMGMFHINVGF